jgi:hypothetical protein
MTDSKPRQRHNKTIDEGKREHKNRIKTHSSGHSQTQRRGSGGTPSERNTRKLLRRNSSYMTVRSFVRSKRSARHECAHLFHPYTLRNNQLRVQNQLGRTTAICLSLVHRTSLASIAQFPGTFLGPNPMSSVGLIDPR